MCPLGDAPDCPRICGRVNANVRRSINAQDTISRWFAARVQFAIVRCCGDFESQVPANISHSLGMEAGDQSNTAAIAVSIEVSSSQFLEFLGSARISKPSRVRRLARYCMFRQHASRDPDNRMSSAIASPTYIGARFTAPVSNSGAIGLFGNRSVAHSRQFNPHFP